eukprot:c2642_g1_i1.p1 GENE.c2642_g1_i1~~c2642_g1_i1.p1  ORF type:complete len:527 (+),score=137.51 c2642_g1_i1:201-1583(+)
MAVLSGEAQFGEQLHMISTLYRDPVSKQFDEKDYKLSVFESSMGKKVGKAHVDFSQFVNTRTGDVLELELEGKFTTKPKLKVVIECTFISNADPFSDAASDMSFVTNGVSESLSEAAGDVGDVNDFKDNEFLLPPTSATQGQKSSPQLGGLDLAAHVKQLMQQVDQFRRDKADLELQNAKLREQIQSLKNEKGSWKLQQVQLSDECVRLKEQVAELTQQISSANEAPRASVSEAKVMSEIFDGVDLTNPKTSMLIESIEMQAIIRDKLGREISALESEVKRLQYANGGSVLPRPSMTKQADSVLLSRIVTLEESLAQAKADNFELKHIIMELTIQFGLYLDRTSDADSRLKCMGETVKILGEHIGNILNEKEETIQQQLENRERELAESKQEDSESYLRTRMKRVELELATELQDKELKKQRLASLEEQNSRYRQVITALGQRVAELEVKLMGSPSIQNK